MTIHLPADLERSIESAVQSGRFASVDEAMAKAARLLLRDMDSEPQPANHASASSSPLGFIGSMREDADLLDQAVEYAMRVREERPWRLSGVE